VGTVVLDECQEYFSAHTDRDESYQEMLTIISKPPIQKVFDSATIPVCLMDTLLQKVHLGGTPRSYIIIHQDTSRPELAHHVLRIPRSLPVSRSVLDVTTELARTLRGILKPEERMIVFVMQVPDADHLSGTIGCPQYHSCLPEQEDKGKGKEKRREVRTIKDRNHDCWVEGQSKVIVATPALIQGIDYSWVRFVVFHLGAYGLISYYQGAGRGGHSRSRCDIFTILNPRAGFSLKNRPEDIEGVAAWKDFTSTRRCRVSVISSYFDGVQMDCRKIEHQQRCDNCLPTDGYQILATQIVHKQGGQPLQDGGSKRPATDHLSSFSEAWDRDPSWDTAIYAEADRIEVRELKRSRLDHSSGPPAASLSCSSPASASYSHRGPWTAWGRVPRQPTIAPPPSNFFPGMSREDNASFNSSPSLVGCCSTPIPPSSGDSMVGSAIAQAAAANSASDMERRHKSELLDSFMPMLVGTCPICFILTRRRVRSHEIGYQETSDTKHCPFFDCPFDELLGPGPHPTIKEFFDWRKKIKLEPPYRYCWTCAMPQTLKGDDLEPICHKQWAGTSTRSKLSSKNGNGNPAGKRNCPWANIIQASMFVLRLDGQAMQELLPHFNFTTSDDPTVTLAEWTQFLNIDLADQGEYWKGLEVFLFKVAEYGLIQNF
jgi:hypothetical protein